MKSQSNKVGTATNGSIRMTNSDRILPLFVVCMLGCGGENERANPQAKEADMHQEASSGESRRSGHEAAHLKADCDIYLFGCKPSELPLTEAICRRGKVMYFESQLRDPPAEDPGAAKDIEWLSRLNPGECYYGAASCPAFPFVCDVPPNVPLTARVVLGALKAKDFKSKYIASLDTTQIPYPGYHPQGGKGVDNDEIHTDFASQHIFQSKDEDGKKPVDPYRGVHGALKHYVRDRQLWYVLLHTAAKPTGEFRFSEYVILFAVGRSPNGDRLVGVVTHQVCHNLCD